VTSKLHRAGGERLEPHFRSSGPLGLATKSVAGNKPWDSAVGVVIAREAGALVVDRDRSAHTFKSSATIAAGPNLLPAITNLIREAA
jgi:fructose-1,6-bisphosphatase/inositol monophosphatase family enzyme